MAEKLKNTIKIGDTDYDVTAVEADRVKGTLTLQKVTLKGKGSENPSDKICYNGSNSPTLELVTAEGGRFNGPIRVPENTNSTIDNEAVLNYKDLTNKVFNKFINTSSVATWKDGEFTFINKADSSFNGISIVIGPEDVSGEAGITDFAIENFNSKWLSAYLYIEENQGNIYYGTSANSNFIQVARNAVAICGNVDGQDLNYEAADIKDIEDALLGILVDSDLSYVQKAKIADNAIEADHASDADYASNLRFTNPGGTEELPAEYIKHQLDDHSTGISYIMSALADIIGGIVTVGKAKVATQDGAAVPVDIHKNYYRSGSSTYINTITVSKNQPTNPQPGDIWIQYS